MSWTVLHKLKLKDGRTYKLATFTNHIYTHTKVNEGFGENYLKLWGNNIGAYDATEHFYLANESNNHWFYSFIRADNKSVQVGLCKGENQEVWAIGYNYASGYERQYRTAMWGLAYNDVTNLACITLIVRNNDNEVDNDGRYHIFSMILEKAEEIIDWLEGAGSDDDDPYDPVDPDPRPDPEPLPDPDPIPIPDLPTIGAVDTGFIKLYNPKIFQLKNLADFMWSDLFDIESTFKKLFGNPMNAIIGLSMMPFDIPNGPAANVIIGNVDSGISMNVCSNQFYELNCGTITVHPKWNAYLDYSPYTSIELYLPFCGTHPLDTDEVMGKNIQVVYHIDVLNGSCIAFVKVANSVLYEFSGQVSSMIPISGNNWADTIKAVMASVVSIGSMVASGGATAPVAIPSLATNVVNGKPRVEKSGSLSGPAGALGVLKPYLIIKRPNQCVPGYQNKYIGYPAFKTVKLSNLSGYTIVEEIHLENIPATDDEKDEIERLLKEGVII